jgi:hypothetical protein
MILSQFIEVFAFFKSMFKYICPVLFKLKSLKAIFNKMMVKIDYIEMRSMRIRTAGFGLEKQ